MTTYLYKLNVSALCQQVITAQLPQRSISNIHIHIYRTVYGYA